MPVVAAGQGLFRIPNVPGTGSRAMKTKQLAAIKISQAKRHNSGHRRKKK